MAIQRNRPFLMGGEINDNRYVGNFFMMDREHPNPMMAEIANRVLIEIGGYSPGAEDDTEVCRGPVQSVEAVGEFMAEAYAWVVQAGGTKRPSHKKIEEGLRAYIAEHWEARGFHVGGGSAGQSMSVDDLPRFVPLMVELQGDDLRRDLYRALYDALATHIQKSFPRLAVGAQIRAHLTALGAQGGYGEGPSYEPPEEERLAWEAARMTADERAAWEGREFVKGDVKRAEPRTVTARRLNGRASKATGEVVKGLAGGQEAGYTVVDAEIIGGGGGDVEIIGGGGGEVEDLPPVGVGVEFWKEGPEELRGVTPGVAEGPDETSAAEGAREFNDRSVKGGIIQMRRGR